MDVHGIPPDLEHLISDQELGIRDGFWGCVRRGLSLTAWEPSTSAT
jgi:hypothetical protein